MRDTVRFYFYEWVAQVCTLSHTSIKVNPIKSRMMLGGDFARHFGLHIECMGLNLWDAQSTDFSPNTRSVMFSRQTTCRMGVNPVSASIACAGVPLIVFVSLLLFSATVASSFTRTGVLIHVVLAAGGFVD